MKNHLLLLLNILYTSIIYGQVLHQYNGPYLLDNGKAIYSYYENDNLERIYDGKFEFRSKNYLIFGIYRSNLKNGPWVYTQFDTSSYTKIKTKTIIKGNYVDGYLDGIWTLKKTILNTKRVIKSSTCEFKLGIPVGVYLYFDSSLLKPNLSDQFNITVQGKYDSTGKKVNKWTINYNQSFTQGISNSQVIREYISDEKIKVIRRDLNTGYVKTDTIDRYWGSEHSADEWNCFECDLNWDRCLSFWQCADIYKNCPNNLIFTLLTKGSTFINLDNSKSEKE